jgi:hypothetical protein
MEKRPVRLLASARRYTLADALVVAALAALVVAAFWEVIVQGRVFFFRDFAVFFYPKRHLVAEAVRNGRIPFWSSLNGCGEPVLGAYQPAVFYPLALIYYVFPMPASLMWFVLVHLVISGAGAYYMMRVWGARRPAAAFAAFAWAFSPVFVSIVDFVSFITSLAWLPWCLAFARRTAIGSSFRGFLWLSLSFAMAVLAAAPEPVIFIALILAAYAAWELVRAWRRRGLSRAWRRPALILAATFVGVAAAGVETVPFFHTLLYSGRQSKLPVNDAGAWAAAPGDSLLLLLPRFYLFTDRGGIYWRSQYWLKTVYLGVLVPFLVIWAVAAVRRARTLFFAALALPFILLALGPHLPVWPLAYEHVYGVGLIRFVVKFYLPAAFALAAVSGFAVDDLLVCARRREILRPAILVAAIVFIAVLFAAGWWLMDRFPDDIYRRITPLNLSGVPTVTVEQAAECYEATEWSFGRSAACLAGGAVALCIAVLLARLRIPRPYGGIALAIALFADVGIFGAHLNPLDGPEIYTERPSRAALVPDSPGDTRVFMTPTLRHNIARGRLKGFRDAAQLREYVSLIKGINFPSDADFFRWLERTSTPRFTGVAQLDAWLAETEHLQFLTDLEYEVSKETFYPNTNALYSIPMINDFEPMAVARQYEIMLRAYQFQLPEARVKDLSRLWGASVVLEARAEPPGFVFLPLEKPGSRAVLADHYVVAADDRQADSILTESDIDVTRRIVLSPADAETAAAFLGASAAEVPSDDAAAPGTAHVAYDDGNRLVLDVDAARRAILFVADNYFPNFAASVDGRCVPIMRANYAYRALLVEPGRHKVEFFWRPYDFYAGIAVTLLTIVALAAAPRFLRNRSTSVFSSGAGNS